MAAILKSWREAATLILISRSKFGAIPKKASSALEPINYEMLMIKRSPESPFMPNTYVFPGGVADNADFSTEWMNLFSKMSNDTMKNLDNTFKNNGTGAPMFSRVRDSKYSSFSSELAFRICAIRETFEECGILLARDIEQDFKHPNKFDLNFSKTSKLSKPSFDIWRQKVNKDAGEFLNMCRELHLVPDVWSLHEWSNWLTPTSDLLAPLTKRRFDTAFFIAMCEDQPTIIRDTRETAEALWVKPSEFIQDYASFALSFMTPQFYEIARLLNFPKIDDLHRFCEEKTSRVERLFSVRCKLKDCILSLLPGDSLYPGDPDVHAQPVLHMDKTFDEIVREGGNRHCIRVLRFTEEGSPPTITLHCSLESVCGNIAPLIPMQYQTSKL